MLPHAATESEARTAGPPDGGRTEPDELITRFWFVCVVLFAAMCFGLYLVSLWRPRQDQDYLAGMLVFAPVMLSLVVLGVIARKRLSRQPPVMLPFMGAAPASLPPAEEMGPYAAALQALIDRAAALRQEEWDDVLRPFGRGVSAGGARAARRAFQHADEALSRTAEGRRAREAFADHVRAGFAREDVTANLLAPSFVYAAGVALLARDAIGGKAFRALYAPFDVVIPLAALPPEGSQAAALAPPDPSR